VRFVNILCGAWVIASPWVLGGATTGSTLSDMIAGAFVILLSVPRSTVGERYGECEKYIR
jgi:hypothetical protein